MAQTQVEPGPPAIRSFRDPAGVLIRYRDRILRVVEPAAAETLMQFLATGTARQATASGRLISTVRRDDPLMALDLGAPPEATIVEHEQIWFPSYPYEWPPEMLHAAAALTLSLAVESLRDGFCLKDATPYNVLFQGPRPVFVDLLSFEKRHPLDPSWIPYAQFIRTFLLPLLVSGRFGLPPDALLLKHRDGLEPESVYRWCGWSDRLRPPFLGLVTIPAWLAGARKAQDPANYAPARGRSADQAAYVLNAILGGLQRKLASLQPKARDSKWTAYLDTSGLYDAAQLKFKEDFVRRALAECTPRSVLDIGANKGLFSRLAALGGASVVALDSDAAVVGEIWRQARAQGLDILPLVVDATRPTPASGWRNQECASFLDRARNRFDMVLLLAVIHHMAVTERVPLDEIAGLAADLTRRFAIIEFVGPEDAMFRQIARGRESLHAGYNRQAFESAIGRHFEIVRCAQVQGLCRWLYLLRRRTG